MILVKFLQGNLVIENREKLRKESIISPYSPMMSSRDSRGKWITFYSTKIYSKNTLPTLLWMYAGCDGTV